MSAASALQLALLNKKAEAERRLIAAEPIAVVGIGCRFPGGPGRPDVDSPEAFWDFLQDGREAISAVPADRWQVDAFYDPTPGTPGRTHCRQGGFLAQVDQFDPARFGISPREAQAMDPQQRLLLEVALEALERAGLSERQLSGSSTGVYVGLCTTDYAWRQLRGGAADSCFDMYFATGTTLSMAAGRLAYCLGLQGPAMAIDTACSSSLVALDLACRSLRDRSSDVALAGGVNLMLAPYSTLCFSRSGMMAGDGHCKTFDAAADGYVRGEGCGIVVLKRLADAIAAGDPIWGVIRASAVNQDGASAGLTVPNGDAQRSLIQRTLSQAQLEGDQIDVLEAHGTGTSLGDPIELKAFAPIYARKQRTAPLQIGSVKTNLGHLEAAAGIAGLIKSVLMVRHGLIPPHLHLRQPTPYVNWDQWSLQIPTSPTPWPRQDSQPRRAAVSSFGFSGTNAHVVVEQPPVEVSLPWPQPSAEKAQGDWLLLSAPSEASLQSLAAAFQVWLVDQPAQAWTAICATARQARSQQRCRLALRAPSSAAALRLLQGWLAGDAPTDTLLEARVPSPVPRLALELGADSRAEHWQEWLELGVQPSALVYGPESRGLAEQLAGSPPQLRLIAAGPQAAAQLAEHGYGDVEPLAFPAPEVMVRLWLAGHPLLWDRLDPPAPWPRQVLPTTPFDRSRCWIEEEARVADPADRSQRLMLTAAWQEASADDGRRAPGGSLLLLGGEAEQAARIRQGLEGDRVAAVQHLATLAELETWLEPPHPTDEARPDLPELVVLSALAPLVADSSSPLSSPLNVSFWEQWLPLLQGLLPLAPRLKGIHWALAEAGSADGEGMAALLRCWMRELGDQAGGLLHCAAGGQGLAELLRGGRRPGPCQEWRWEGERIQQRVLRPVDLPERAAAPFSLPAGATTIISGGLGALGLATARWLQRCGASHLTLLGRRRPDPAQEQALAELRSGGTEVEFALIDVTDADQVRGLIDQIVGTGRPLAGIIHAAGLIDDGLITNQTPARCAAVAAAKVLGALHLDRFTRALQPRFFVTYSSVAAVLGSPGQSAYGAANGWLDGWMEQRRRAGLPAVSINWGPWEGAGMASRSPVNLARLQPELALRALERCLGQADALPAAHVVVADLEQTAGSQPLASRVKQLADALQDLPDRLGPEAQACTEACLADLLAELGGFSLASLQSDTRLDELGLDSLMAVDLATALQAGLGVNLGLGALVGDPTLGSLARHLLGLLHNPEGVGQEGLDLAEEAQLPQDVIDLLAAAPAVGEAAVGHGPGSAILFTGATGFLGAYLLADQLERHPDLTIYCLVRADGPAMARSRVRSNLGHYGLWREAYAQRLIGLPGDLAAPRLGLEESTWANLAARLGGILHNGAQLSYVAPYGQLRASNVQGTIEVLRLACRPCTEAKPPLPVEFISSTAVYEAAAYRGQDLDEGSDLKEWQGIHLGYSQTKWVSERLVWHAARMGLPVRLYRPPLIAGHSVTGAWHEQDFLHRLLRGCLAMGRAPDLEMALDLVPVDYVVAAVGACAWGAQSPPSLPAVLHLHHPEPVMWLDLLQALIDHGAPLRRVPLADWLETLAGEPDNPLYPLQPFFTHRWGEEQLTYPQLNSLQYKAKPSCLRTIKQLDSFGIRCPGFAALIGPYARTFLAGMVQGA